MTGTRSRYEPSGTTIGSTGSATRAYNARRSTAAIRASCLTRAASSVSTARGGRPLSTSSSVHCCTSTSPSAGSTAEM